MGVFTGGALEEPIVRRADLIIAFGLDPVELIPRRWPYAAPVLSLGARPVDAIPRCAPPGGGAYFTPALEVVGDLALDPRGARAAPRRARTPARTGTWPRWTGCGASARRALEVPVPGLAPHRVVQITRELMPAGAIATVDAGAHMFPATAYWHAVEPGECLISNGLATMGFALPAAIAAQLVHPERRVVCFTGDGGLLMVASELETAARLRLPIVIVVFDDGALSLIEVKQEQKGYRGRRRCATRVPISPRSARAFGLGAFAATDEAGLERALISALGRARPDPDRRAHRRVGLPPDARDRPRRAATAVSGGASSICCRQAATYNPPWDSSPRRTSGGPEGVRAHRRAGEAHGLRLRARAPSTNAQTVP